MDYDYRRCKRQWQWIGELFCWCESRFCQPEQFIDSRWSDSEHHASRRHADLYLWCHAHGPNFYDCGWEWQYQCHSIEWLRVDCEQWCILDCDYGRYQWQWQRAGELHH